MTSSQTALSQALGHLPGGHWHYLPPSGGGSLTMRHTFHWQIEGALLVGESVSSNGVSFSYWYWHPGNQRIQMLSVGKALEDGSLAEYTAVTRAQDTLVCQLTTHDAQGGQHYREEWRFTDHDHYAWSLYHLPPGGETLVMQASFERRPE